MRAVRVSHSYENRIHAQMLYYYMTVSGRQLRRAALQSVFYHPWGSELFRRGTIVHEFLHTRGLSDHCPGLGFFDLMCQNKGWRGDYLRPTLGAPHRVILGFSHMHKVHCSGLRLLLPAFGAEKDTVLVLPEDTGETMLEFRRPVGLDLDLPCSDGVCGGVVAWQVDGRKQAVLSFRRDIDFANGGVDDFGQSGQVLRTKKWTVGVVAVRDEGALVQLLTQSC